MFAEIESLLHRLRRRFSRSEWAIRHLGFRPAEGTGEEPGLLIIQIDGLARSQMERAVHSGRMPFLARLLRRNGCALRTFYPGIPSTTPAVQAEMFYGIRSAVPAFRYRDRERGKMVSMFEPSAVREVEADLAASARGLLEGGSSWSNIYCGGASETESHFCVASLGPGDSWRASAIPARIVFAFMQLPALIRITGLVVLELIIGLGDALWGILCRRQPPLLELGMLLSRMCVGIGLREVVTIGAKVDLARGLPIIHVNFLGYDEAAHRRGPGSKFAHWTLRGIDRAARQLWLAAQRSRRRDYEVWVMSDHGQERARSFAEDYGGLENVIARILRTPPPVSAPEVPRRPLRRRPIEETPMHPIDGPFEVAAMGPVGHLYLRDAFDPDALATRLVNEARIPGVLRHDAHGGVIWHHANGKSSLPAASDRLVTHPTELRREVARDLAVLCQHKNAGDLVLLGWDPASGPWTFPRERGAHAGPGPEETQGFLITPCGTSIASALEGFVRPAELREAALHLLGRSRKIRARDSRNARMGSFRLMSYNVHSCIGTDGRVSPRRIARVIAEQNPDIVAVQEVEHGRARSRQEDQTALLAEALGFHFAFCAAIEIGNERYGHAVLSRHPIEVVKMGILPSPTRALWPERRAALWTRLEIDGRRLHLLTTHLGLSRAERLQQIEAILGTEWIGGIVDDEPTIFCGDCNFSARSAACRLLQRRMQSATADSRKLQTFTSAHPFVQLDHIFHSGHLTVERVQTVRNDASRVASDHLPLLADLRFV